MSLAEQIKQIVDEHVLKFINQISIQFQLDTNRLTQIWKNDLNDTEVIPSQSSNILTTTTKTGCPYVFVKGGKKNQACGLKPKDNSNYCSRHQKSEEQKHPKKEIKPISTKVCAKPRIVLQRKKEIGNKLYHTETGFVFDSPTQRTVIGKCIDSEIVPLNETDLKTCDKWHLEYQKQIPETDTRPVQDIIKQMYMTNQEPITENKHTSGDENDEDLEDEDEDLEDEDEDLEDEDEDEDLEG